MRISYGRTAYVDTSSDRILDGIENFQGLNGWATGQGNFCVCYEELISALDGVAEEGLKSLDENERKVYDFLMEVNNELEGEIGDIVFSN